MEHELNTLSNMWKNLIITQTICIILSMVGIIIEFIYEANIGFLAINCGAVLFAYSTKVENYLLIKREDKSNEKTTHKSSKMAVSKSNTRAHKGRD